MKIIPTRFGGPWFPSFVYLVIGCVIMAFGISLEVTADVIMLPAEALVRAIAQKTKIRFGNVKVCFDSTLYHTCDDRCNAGVPQTEWSQRRYFI